jgi:uncharacterized protein (TIGR02246 family)
VVLTKQSVRSVVDVYMRAWVTQDPELVTTVFTPDATYHERVFDAPIRGADGIRSYWQSKVVESQANITCRLLDLLFDGTTAVAEWEAEFDDVQQQVRKRMREVAILVFDGQLIASLCEYWSSQKIAELSGTSQSRQP